MVQKQIEERLRVLIGLPLWAAGRAADLEWFHFGAQRTVPRHNGGTKEVGDYALHVQCAWRVRSSSQIIVASRDRYFPADDSQDDEDFNWDVPGANLCDRKMTAWLDSFKGQSPIVQHVTADGVGSVCLILSDDFRLEIFPDDTQVDEYAEYWRFFKPTTDEAHFVMRAGSTFLLDE
jgi:hypothetical protein